MSSRVQTHTCFFKYLAASQRMNPSKRRKSCKAEIIFKNAYHPICFLHIFNEDIWSFISLSHENFKTRFDNFYMSDGNFCPFKNRARRFLIKWARKKNLSKFSYSFLQLLFNCKSKLKPIYLEGVNITKNLLRQGTLPNILCHTCTINNIQHWPPFSTFTFISIKNRFKTSYISRINVKY